MRPARSTLTTCNQVVHIHCRLLDDPHCERNKVTKGVAQVTKAEIATGIRQDMQGEVTKYAAEAPPLFT